MKDPMFYKIVRPFIAIWFKLAYKPVVINNGVIPKKGKVLIAGTHTCKKDVFMVLVSTKRCVRGVAKDELFKGPGKYLFNGLGAIPVNRKSKDDTVIPRCVEILNNEGMVGIMPEGTINRTDDLQILPFKTGAVRMSIESNTPIIPFIIVGEVIKNYGSFRKGPKIIFGEPYHPKTKDIVKETKVLENKIIDMLNEHKNKGE